jgi:hypothetical protein
MFKTKAVYKIKTHFMLNNFFPENRTVYEMWKKNGRTRQATDDSTAHALCLLDHVGYRHTLKFVILAAFTR